MRCTSIHIGHSMIDVEQHVMTLRHQLVRAQVCSLCTYLHTCQIFIVSCVLPHVTHTHTHTHTQIQSVDGLTSKELEAAKNKAKFNSMHRLVRLSSTRVHFLKPQPFSSICFVHVQCNSL